MLCSAASLASAWRRTRGSPPPRPAPPPSLQVLDRYVPRPALTITQGDSSLGRLEMFLEIMLLSCVLGIMGYLSLLANFNDPSASNE